METRSPVAASVIEVRPLDDDDGEAVAPLEAAYAERHACAPLAGAAALRHYARGGHAFVARSEGAAVGLALAHTVWDGARPVVRLARLSAAGDDHDVLRRLVGAVVKSAYDAAVYDLVAELPEGDAAGRAALQEHAFASTPVTRFERVLGSRSAESA